MQSNEQKARIFTEFSADDIKNNAKDRLQGGSHRPTWPETIWSRATSWLLSLRKNSKAVTKRRQAALYPNPQLLNKQQ
jgi:hypothetical protein